MTSKNKTALRRAAISVVVMIGALLIGHGLLMGGLYTDHQGWGLDRRIGERRRLISSFEFAMLMETDNG